MSGSSLDCGIARRSAPVRAIRGRVFQGVGRLGCEPVRFEPDTLSDPLEDMLLAAACAEDTPRLLIAAEVAAVLRVDPGWVYDHATLLGALRLGTGRRRAVRFEARTVAARLRALGDGTNPPPRQESAPTVQRRRARSSRKADAADLLPVRPRLEEVLRGSSG